jgi:vancomycin resistance protein YoaR
LRSIAALWQYGLDIPMRIDVDQTAVQQYLLAHLKEIEQPAVDAQVIIDGTRVSVTPAQPGRQVLTDETLADVTAAIQSLEPRTINVRTRPLLPLLDDADANAAKQSIKTVLQAPLTLVAHEDSWVWHPDDLVKMVHVDREPDPAAAGDRLVVSFNEQLARQHLAWYSEQTEEPGVYPRVDWNGGNLTIFREGSPGARIDEDRAAVMVQEAVWTPERTLTLPYEDVPVPSTSAELAQLGINELISVGRSDFTDSQDYRVTNIVAGMRLLHGVLLAPGDEFSFNETIESIGPHNGFVEGYAIVDDKTQLEWGGGICQDSTTMMRAAFWAGLPFTERWNHSRYISWYDKYGYGDYGDGPGIDSTIFLGGADLRFINDTDAWILIQSYANPSAELAEVRMYGTRGGRTVEFGGARVSYRDNGFMDVAFTRIIKEDGVEVNRRTYWSSYEPW